MERFGSHVSFLRLKGCGLRFRVWLSALCFLSVAIFHDTWLLSWHLVSESHCLV